MLHKPEHPRLLEDEEFEKTPEIDRLAYRRKSRKSAALIVVLSSLLAFSVSLNLANYLRHSHLWCLTQSKTSQFASLDWNTCQPWSYHNEYDDINLTRSNDAWSRINIDAGTIALSDAIANAAGLPLSQRFPWDPKKGIYLLNGFHNLHCLKKLHTSLIEYHTSQPQSTPLSHQLHCLDALRQEVLCSADDTPRFTGNGQEPKMSGNGQERKCRDWQKMEAWAKQHTACYRYVNSTVKDFDTLERYKYCPEGSPYFARIKTVFGDFEPIA